MFPSSRVCRKHVSSFSLGTPLFTLVCLFLHRVFFVSPLCIHCAFSCTRFAQLEVGSLECGAPLYGSLKQTLHLRGAEHTNKHIERQFYSADLPRDSCRNMSFRSSESSARLSLATAASKPVLEHEDTAVTEAVSAMAATVNGAFDAT